MAIGTDDETTRRISLDPVAHRPKLPEVDPRTTTVSERLSFTLAASDQHGNALRYSAAGLPAHASFDAETRTFTWRPRPGQEGTWVVGFDVVDATGATERLQVRIAVRSIRDTLERKLLAHEHADA